MATETSTDNSSGDTVLLCPLLLLVASSSVHKELAGLDNGTMGEVQEVWHSMIELNWAWLLDCVTVPYVLLWWVGL